MKNVTIRSFQKGDYEEWKHMFLDYAPNWKMNDKHLKHVWKLLMNPNSVLEGSIASKDSESSPVGFMHCVVYPSTARGRMICYIHDLYIAPAHRRQGFATAMLKKLRTIGKREKWRYIYWKTDKKNKNAQKLYDSIVDRTDRIYYEMRF